jgi:hypothetical protein
MSPRSLLDHVVVACRTLDEGREWAEAVLGVTPSGGGVHVGLGTHNTLVRLDDRTYLELIAPDPAQPAPGSPRWFGLDTPSVQARIAHGPALVAWVARVEGASDALARVARLPGNASSSIRPAARGDYRWRFAFTEAGTLPMGGAAPHYMAWDSPHHPASTLPESGVHLVGLLGGTPDAVALGELLAASGLADPRVMVGQSATPHLIATFATPRGRVIVE